MKRKTWYMIAGAIGLTIFMAIVAFILLVIGVQHGDTYVENRQHSFAASAKYVIKQSLRAVRNGIYHEATILNPEGDTIPDWWDDALLGVIRKLL